MMMMTTSHVLPTTIAPCSSWNWKSAVSGKRVMLPSNNKNNNSSSSNCSITDKVCGGPVRAFFPNSSQQQQPILKEALKEPVAFVGGIFAGLLRLDLNEEPLKEWISRTVEASGISAEEIRKSTGADYGGEEEMPQEIQIE